jgi:steroid delta-isomerase-like uncharacterized protein
MATAQKNVEVARRWFDEVWNGRRAETIHELLLPDSVGHLENGDVVGPHAFAAVHAEFLKAFPDLQVTVEDTVAEGDRVVVRWSLSARHHGHGLGKAATGKEVKCRGMTWMRLRDGKLVEGWDAWNLGGMMGRLGP